MSGHPVLGLTGHGNERLKVIETEGCPVAPFPRLILERSREGRCEERSLLAGVLPDRRLDVPTSQLVRRFLVGSHLVSSFVELKLALAQEEESQRTDHGGNTRQSRGRRAGEDQAAGVTVLLARAVRLAGASRSATAGGDATMRRQCDAGRADIARNDWRYLFIFTCWLTLFHRVGNESATTFFARLYTFHLDSIFCRTFIHQS